MLEKFKKYREENKEKQKEAQAQYRKEHSEIIQCECGATINILGKGKHIKRKQHMRFIANKSSDLNQDHNIL